MPKKRAKKKPAPEPEPEVVEDVRRARAASRCPRPAPNGERAVETPTHRCRSGVHAATNAVEPEARRR